MPVLMSFVTVVHIILCVFIVLAVLVQQGKGAEISASFSGSSQTVFGSSGGANFFQIFTGVCAALFMITSVFLATQGGNRMMAKSVMDVAVPANSTQNSPAAGMSQQTGVPANSSDAGVKAANQAAHPVAPDPATQNALSPATAMQNGAAAGPVAAKPVAPTTQAPATAPSSK